MRIVYGGSEDEFEGLIQSLGLNEQDRQLYERSHRWDEFQRERDPQFPDRVFALLTREHILPEDYNGFVFLSVSANRAHIEEGIARNIDARVRDEHLDKRPLVVASDIVRTDDNGHLKPMNADREKPTFEDVDFSYLLADARNMPVKSGGVDMIWDRLGAMWHIGSHADDAAKLDKKGGLPQVEYRKTALALLERYGGLLKENGKILLDAYELPSISPSSRMPDSTGVKLLYFFDTYDQDGGDYIDRKRRGSFQRDLATIGLQYKLIGQGKDRLMVIEKINDN